MTESNERNCHSYSYTEHIVNKNDPEKIYITI